MTSKNAVERIKKLLGLIPETFFEAKTEQGMAMKMEGELEVGQPIYVSTEEGMIPAPAGVHKLEDGSEIEVDEEGKIAKIKMGDMEKEVDDVEIEDDKEEETVADEDMSEVELEFGDVKLVDGTIIRMEGEGEIYGRRVKKVGYDGTLSAIADGEYETVGGDVLQIVGGAIKGVQSKADNAKRKTGFSDNETETFVTAKDKSGLLLSSPDFKVGDYVEVIQEDGSKTRAKDQSYDIDIKGEPHTITVTDGKIEVVSPQRKAEGPEDVEVKMSDMEKFTEMFAEALKKIEDKLDDISKKNETLETKFSKFSKEPAGSRVYTQKTINEEENPLMSKYEAFRKMREDMSKN